MKVECVREKLERAVSLASNVTGKDLSLPVLKCVLLIVKNSTLIVRSTNLDLGVEVRISVKTDKEGVVAVPADILKNFLTSLYNDKKVFLELKDSTLVVTTNHTKTQIKTLSHDEFPSIPVLEDATAISLPATKFLEGLNSVYYTASPSSMKPELASVYIHKENSQLIFAATDSFRLAEKKVKIKNLDEFPSLLIPHKNVVEILKILDNTGDDVELHLSDNQIALKQGDVYITSRVVDGVFPDYRQIIPKEHTTEAVMLKKDLQGALKLSNIFADKFNQITLVIDPKKKVFEIQTTNSDVGENKGQVDAAINGEVVEMSFNYRYIIECFQSITTDSVSLGLSSGKPMVIKGVGDENFLYLVMSMNR
ncbi:MAG: DNA polymerase III subunit beta [Candidatus Paceibacterota bacterium]